MRLMKTSESSSACVLGMLGLFAKKTTTTTTTKKKHKSVVILVQIRMPHASSTKLFKSRNLTCQFLHRN